MIDLDKLAEEWKSPFVARSEMEKFSKGLYKSRSMNTLDAAGKGIKRKIRRNAKVAYLKEDVVAWLKERTKNGK